MLKGLVLVTAHVPNLFEETGLPVEAGVSLENDEDDVGGPAHESQHHAAAQEEPVVVVVVHQALQCARDQGLALGDLGGEQAEGRRVKEQRKKLNKNCYSGCCIFIYFFQIIHTDTPISQLGLQN